MEVKIFFSLSLFFLSCFQLQRSFSHLSTGKIKFEERPTLRSRSVTFDWLYRKSGWNFVFSSSLNCCRVFGEAVAFSSGLSINALLYGLTSWGFADKRRETPFKQNYRWLIYPGGILRGNLHSNSIFHFLKREFFMKDR